jgi:ribosomal protein S18 acetylase RimI-like enzyme
MIIRKARKGDEKAIAKLDQKFWDFHKKIDPLVVPVKINHIQNAKGITKNKDIFYYVAEIDYQIMGAISFQIKKNNDFFKVEEYGYIDAVVIDCKCKKVDIAKDLVKFAFNFMRKKKIKYVKTNVYLKDIIARKSYKSLGFKEKSINLFRKL